MRLGNSLWLVVMLVASELVAAPLKIDILDFDKNIRDTWQLDGEYVCKWEGSDLVLNFSDKKEPNALSVRLAGLKPVLGNNSVVSATMDLDTKSDVVVTNQYKFQYAMTAPHKDYEWVGSKCSATVSASKNSPGMQFAVACEGLAEKENKLSGLLNMQPSRPFFRVSVKRERRHPDSNRG